MFFTFLLGFLFGLASVAFALWYYIYDPWGPVDHSEPFVDQFRPIQIPDELRDFLKTGKDGVGISAWESCHSLSLFMHMFYQEHKDSRQLRRWMQKRLQMELNDIATRSAAGRLLQEIRIRDLSLGTKFPCLNQMRVENVEMSEDKSTFESITFLLNVEYTGGFETSVDVTTVLAKANLSIKISKLKGLVRLILSRKPYSHWTMSFVTMPEFETDVSSQVSGHQLKRLIPLIKESIRRALQRKHVWPNYKIRYRPVFPNPLLQPSPPLSAFTHVKLEGGLEITVLKCTRLKVDLLDKEGNWDVYCTLGMDPRPFLQNNSQNVAHSLSVMLVFSRYDLAAPVGVTFEKHNTAVTPSVGCRPVRVGSVVPGSLADKAMLKPGDTFVAINNVPIRSERQVLRFLEQTLGDLMVLVDRNLDDMDDEELRECEEIIGDPNGDPDDAFIALGCMKGAKVPGVTSPIMGQAEEGRDRQRRHSLSAEPSSSSIFGGTTESVNTSMQSLDVESKFEDLPVSSSLPATSPPHLVQRAESARVPHVLISQPSMDLRRTRSESQIDTKGMDSSSTVVPSPAPEDVVVEEEMTMVNVQPLSREARNNDVAEPVRKEEGLVVDGKDDGRMVRGGSSVSLQSSQSTRTDVTDDGDEELNRDRPASTRRHRLQATLQAGKKKMMDFMPAKKKAPHSPGDPIEVGADACEMPVEDKSDSGSPAHLGGKRSPIEFKVIDKVESKEKKKRRKWNSSHSDVRNQDSPTASTGSVKSRTTRCTPLRENILWGQSLHFALDGKGSGNGSPTTPNGQRLPCKYLNITVHAKQKATEGAATGPEEPARPVLLGYTSLYIPQLIDDCTLTLSNCHREVFPLKPPIGMEPQLTSNSSEFARHAGFDPRLCFGDITLGFRYFPQGFPEEACINAGDETEEAVQEQAPTTERPFSPPSVKPMPHEWTPWSSKNSGGSVCAMCRGKIWLKAGSCCQRCLVVCHVKCTGKANSGIVCTPQTTVDDGNFEMLDDELNTAMVVVEDECPVSIIPTVETTPLTGATAETVSRRTKLKNKVSEKLSMWRRKTKKDPAEPDSNSISQVSEGTTDGSLGPTANDPGSPMASIQDCLSDILPQLEGSPFISGLFFQPGNAYNEQTISHAKQLGKEIFAECTGPERVVKINKQIDTIQQAIRETKDGRLAAMSNKIQEDPSGFENLDERLQALAVVMLHYCAALQDCASSTKSSSTDSLIDAVNGAETELPSPDSEIPYLLNPSGSSSSCLKTDADILSETLDTTVLDEESACRSLSESTVVEMPAAVTSSRQ